MKKVTAASGEYLVYFHPLAKVSNVFMNNGTYPLMFISRLYKTYWHTLEKKQSQCEICETKFSKESNLRRHIQRHIQRHIGGKSFYWGVCGTKFSENANLRKRANSHRRKTHSLWNMWLDVFRKIKFEKVHADTHWWKTFPL